MFAPAAPGQPALAWRSRASTIEGVETELARIWANPILDHDFDGDGVGHRHVGARTSVMNLVVVARRPETGERCAAIIHDLTGRHPSRTLIVMPADPDGPAWLDASIQAHCVLPSETAAATCAETIYLTCGGDAGRHLEAVIAPLLIHDLPVTVWWPDEPPFEMRAAADVFELCDRLVVDGSTWHGSGLPQLRKLAALQDRYPIAISDFALVRQSRWREAIASVFDHPDVLPFVRHLRRITVTYGIRDEIEIEATNIVKPVYHAAWLASRLDMRVVRPLAPIAPAGSGSGRGDVATDAGAPAGLAGSLRTNRREVAVIVRPAMSEMPSGTTLRVELTAVMRGTELRADITAEQEAVHARVWRDGERILERGFNAPRRKDTDLLAEAIEAGGRDPVAVGAMAVAAQLAEEVDR
ncbi:MAG TPA: glucose-6-phosphate dehydrogenase assembly protein OpcA [Candidatus Limnocylindrales bacterium]|nr:glucose-6-phosphate dehydrogenase assembly protein OpcA [Candidatus Limnocylindrales bacterium]